MNAKNRSIFIEIFGGGDPSVADSLITLTTTGKTDLTDSNIPLSGQAYWRKIKSSSIGKEIKKASIFDENKDGISDLPSGKEIRGRRVQAISASMNGIQTDIWTGLWKQRFLDAGQIPDFQEVQIELAVKNYMRPVLRFAKEKNIRSAMGLAFVTACSVRYGPDSPQVELFTRLAEISNIKIPFVKAEDEANILNTISHANGEIGSIKFDPEESRRAKVLLKDELGFLNEDYYDISTY